MDGVAEIREILARRRSLLRALFLLVALLLLGSVVAVAFVGARALAVWLLAPVLLAAYLLADALLLRRWRSRLVCAWLTGQINLGVFAAATATLPLFPKATLTTMLRTLPVLPPLRDRDLLPTEREALAAFSNWRWTAETAAALLSSGMLALLSGLIAVRLLSSGSLDVETTVATLSLLAGAVLLRLSLAWLQRRRLTRAFNDCTSQALHSLPDLVRCLDWSNTTVPRRDCLLRFVDLEVSKRRKGCGFNSQLANFSSSPRL